MAFPPTLCSSIGKGMGREGTGMEGRERLGWRDQEFQDFVWSVLTGLCILEESMYSLFTDLQIQKDFTHQENVEL